MVKIITHFCNQLKMHIIMKKLSMILLIASLSFPALGQKVYQVDELTRKLKEPIAFDMPFFLEIKDKANAIESAEIYRLIMRKGELTEYRKFLCRKIYQDKVLARHQSRTWYKENTRFGFKGLRPDLRFEIILKHKFRGEALKGLLDVVHKYSTVSSDAAYTQFESLSLKLEPKILGEGHRTAMGAVWYDDITNKFTEPEDITREHKKAVRGYMRNELVPIMNKALDNTVHDYMENYPNNWTSSNLRLAEEKYVVQPDYKDLFSSLNQLVRLSRFSEFFKGQIDIAYPRKIARGNDILTRTSNLNKSKEFLERVRKVLEKLIIAPENISGENGHLESVLKDVQTVIVQLKINLSYLKEIHEELIEKLDQEGNMRYTTWYSGTNETRDLKTLGGYLILPHIGAAHIFTPSDHDHLVRPYAGVSIHLRQVNPGIPLRDLNKTLLHRLSFQIGFTVMEIKNNEEYSDLIGKNSLMLGLNYRLHRTFGLSIGTVLMKRANPNPIVTDKQTVANFYMGFSIDLNFASALKSVSGKIGL